MKLTPRPPRTHLAATLFTVLTMTGILAGGGASTQAQSRKEGAKPSPIKNLFWQPDQLQQGSPVQFTVELEGMAVRVSGAWLGKPVTFFRSEKPHVWMALAGADVATEPGNHNLIVVARMRTGRAAKLVEAINVNAADFGTGSVDVPEDYVEPTAVEQKQIAADQMLKKRAFSHLIPQPMWSGNFIKPVDVESTPSFGESRLLNEERTSMHLGTDFPVKEGTPVRASNAGVVVLARALFYEGNCVIVDHGARFYTIYMHLSRIDVRFGERLRKGVKVGLSGATGRVTGPHVHLGVRWEGNYVDPVQLLSLTLPDRVEVERRSAR